MWQIDAFSLVQTSVRGSKIAHQNQGFYTKPFVIKAQVWLFTDCHPGNPFDLKSSNGLESDQQKVLEELEGISNQNSKFSPFKSLFEYIQEGNFTNRWENDPEKAILAPTHEMVDIINQRMLTMLIGDEKEYESSYSICLADGDSNFDDSIYTKEFLNSLRMSGMPHHIIKLKIGTPIMLMRNIDQKVELCNGTRLQALRLGNNIIDAKIISGGSIGKICAIRRMVISPTDTKMPFKLNRRQFPIQVCFAMTINKRQGQTLSQEQALDDGGMLLVNLLEAKAWIMNKLEASLAKLANDVVKSILTHISLVKYRVPEVEFWGKKGKSGEVVQA
nr:ATP-dependent DNA helicase PIF1-like [Tanacetum cinerariifolium]